MGDRAATVPRKNERHQHGADAGNDEDGGIREPHREEAGQSCQSLTPRSVGIGRVEEARSQQQDGHTCVRFLGDNWLGKSNREVSR